MFITLTAMTETGEINDFSLHMDSFETGLDMVNRVLPRNHTLLSVIIHDETGKTILPLEAFDGVPCSVSIQQLEAEWQSILAEPPVKPQFTDPWIQVRFERNQRQIVRQERLLTTLRRLLDQVPYLKVSERYKCILLEHYRALVSSNETVLTQYRSLQKVLLRLNPTFS
jgi:hypothetical protein